MKKEDSPQAVLEEAGVAFDPGSQHLDLTTGEKRRVTALMLAINAYNNLIIKDAAMYVEIRRDVERHEAGAQIKPATIDAMVEAAFKFDLFIAGEYAERDVEVTDIPAESVAPTPEAVLP